MTSTERVNRMLDFQPVDIPALEVDVNSVGIYEHGEKLRDLFQTCPGDFGPINDNPYDALPDPALTFDPDGRMWLPRPEDFDERGDFCRIFTDDWGVAWRYRIFGVQGHPLQSPLNDWEAAAAYRFPEPITGLQFDLLKKDVALQKSRGFFTKRGWINYMERTYSLRNFEDVLADIAIMDEDFLAFTARFHEHNKVLVQRWLDTGADAIQFADDFGMQTSLLISRKSFCEIYKPLYKELVDMVHAAGKRAFYHVCGYVEPLLEDFAEIGFDAIWPQLNAYDLPVLARKCRDLRLAVGIHPDRAGLMTSGSPDEIQQAMNNYRCIFKPEEGGAWLYLEMDNGFPYPNVCALIEAARRWREG